MSRTLSNIEDYCKEIGAEVAPNYEAILANPDIDAVILATPHSMHRQQIDQALGAGAGLVIGFASQLRRLVRSPKAVVLVNRALAVLLVSGGGWMAIS